MSSALDTAPRRYFLDTNIVVYCFDTSAPRKQEIAKELMAHGISSQQGVVSYQVIQEFCNVAMAGRSLRLDKDRALAYATLMLEPMNKVPSSLALIEQALTVKAQTGFHFYDSLLIASAQQAQCQIFYSEDLRHELHVGDVQIINPFVQAVNEPMLTG